MRAIGLAMVAFAFSCMLSPAEAARRGDQATASRPAAHRAVAVSPAARSLTVRTAYAAPSRGVTATPARGQRASRGQAAAAPRRSAPVASACVRRGRHARCAPQRLAWQSGLPPAANVQTADCPEGTMATLATGHANVIRCMPL